jgi:S-adenosylmethionine:tRNA ribosyltransferase-isomerase
MKVDLFDFELPEACIAQHPAMPRDAARLLHVGDTLGDLSVRDLPRLLSPGDVLVFNDTKVVPTRLWGRRGEARVEVTLHKREGAVAWRAFARPAKRLHAGDRIVFVEHFTATVAEKREGGEVVLAFDLASHELLPALERHGAMPLPPYIRRKSPGEARDRSDYQTVYAAREGAVAAPTAGLHFTDELLAALRARGVETVFLTLHVGAGTFLPVKTADVEDHVMHAEWGEIGLEAASRIAAARARGGKVTAVGTTSLRLLETAAGEDGSLAPWSGDTAIFITPGYCFRVVERLMTNFHLPRSTLFMLVCAFSGLERMKAAYAHAIAGGYRFYSYGDASLLERGG